MNSPNEDTRSESVDFVSEAAAITDDGAGCCSGGGEGGGGEGSAGRTRGGAGGCTGVAGTTTRGCVAFLRGRLRATGVATSTCGLRDRFRRAFREDELLDCGPLLVGVRIEGNALELEPTADDDDDDVAALGSTGFSMPSSRWISSSFSADGRVRPEDSEVARQRMMSAWLEIDKP